MRCPGQRGCSVGLWGVDVDPASQQAINGHEIAALRGVGEITRNGGARHAEGDKQDQHPASPPSDPTDDRDPIFHRHTDCLEKPVWMLPEPSRGGNQE